MINATKIISNYLHEVSILLLFLKKSIEIHTAINRQDWNLHVGDSVKPVALINNKSLKIKLKNKNQKTSINDVNK